MSYICYYKRCLENPRVDGSIPPPATTYQRLTAMRAFFMSGSSKIPSLCSTENLVGSPRSEDIIGRFFTPLLDNVWSC
jgi:hypothetical protein